MILLVWEINYTAPEVYNKCLGGVGPSKILAHGHDRFQAGPDQTGEFCNLSIVSNNLMSVLKKNQINIIYSKLSLHVFFVDVEYVYLRVFC